MAITSTPRMITDGLVLHLDAANLKSYPGSGTTWTDLSRTSTSGSLTNGPVFTSSVNGAIFFDGTNDYVRISDSDVYNFTGFTAVVWFNSAIFPAFSQYRIVNQQESTNRAWGIQMARGDYIGTGTSSDMLLFAHTSNNSTWKNLSGNTRLSANTWYHAAFSADGTNMKLYLNGVLDNTTTALAGSPYSTIAGDIGIGVSAQDFANFFWSGSIAMVSLYNRVLSDTEIFNLYETTSERFNRPTLITDSDALNFLNSANIGNDTQRRAINDLVVDMKNAGIWGKMKAIYPFVGGTAASHKWNLKDPRDVDAAFRLTFSGGWTHSSTGALPNGTNGYADSFFKPSSNLSSTSVHASVYTRTDVDGLLVDLSAQGPSSIPQIVLYPRYNGQAIGDIGSYQLSRISVNTPNSLGYLLSSRTSNSLVKLYKNGTMIGSNTTTDTSGVGGNNMTLSVALLTPGGNFVQWSSRQLAFSTIGDGLTDTDAANLYTIVQKYQTTLGRQV